MPGLIVHIGTHKTGTKEIQSALRSAEADLRGEGIALYQPTSQFAALVGSGDADTPGIEQIQSDLRALSGDGIRSVVMSSENLSGSIAEGYRDAGERAQSLKRILQGWDVRLVVYLRRQDSFLESAYTQMVQDGDSLTFREYVRDLPQGAFDWANLISAYEEAFGEGSVVVRPYDHATLDDLGGLLKDFAQVIGSDVLRSRPAVEPRRSLDRSAVELARVCNARLDASKRESLSRLLRSASTRRPFDPQGLFVHGARENTLDTYRDSNTAVVDKYLGSQGAYLLERPRTEFDHDEEGLSIERIATTLVLAILSLVDEPQD